MEVNTDEIFSELKTKALEQIHLKLSPILGVEEVFHHYKTFMRWFTQQEQDKKKELYSASVVYNTQLLQKCLDLLNLPPIEEVRTSDSRDSAPKDDDDIPQTASCPDVNSQCISKVSSAWLYVLEQYQKNALGQAKTDILAEFIIGSNFIKEDLLIGGDEKLDFNQMEKVIESFAYCT